VQSSTTSTNESYGNVYLQQRESSFPFLPCSVPIFRIECKINNALPCPTVPNVLQYCIYISRPEASSLAMGAYSKKRKQRDPATNNGKQHSATSSIVPLTMTTTTTTKSPLPSRPKWRNQAMSRRRRGRRMWFPTLHFPHSVRKSTKALLITFLPLNWRPTISTKDPGPPWSAYEMPTIQVASIIVTTTWPLSITWNRAVTRKLDSRRNRNMLVRGIWN
jgi:hypothetical protein